MIFRPYLFNSAAVLTLAACAPAERTMVSGTSGGAAGAPAAACIDAVETNGGGDATILGVSPSADGAVALVRSGGSTWSCTVTSRGVVTELSLA